MSGFIVDKNEFPGLFLDGLPICYLDSAATSQKPIAVIEACKWASGNGYAQVHRSVYKKANKISEMYEESRELVARFIGAEVDDVVFTSGTTDSINKLVVSLSRMGLVRRKILISEIEHHSNLLPWMELVRSGFEIIKIPLRDNGTIFLDKLEAIIDTDVLLISISMVSHVTGHENDITKISKLAHFFGAWVVVDAAQVVSHTSLDVNDIGCDFVCFSAHKMYGPNSVGVLWGKGELLKKLPPAWLGGNMVDSISNESISFQMPPAKFEAGTMPIPEIIGFGEAVKWMSAVGIEVINRYESMLYKRLVGGLKAIYGVRILGDCNGSAIASFIVNRGAIIHPFDIANLLDSYDVCVRSGDLCAQGAMRFFEVSSVLRASIGVYNTIDDVDYFLNKLEHVIDHLYLDS